MPASINLEAGIHALQKEDRIHFGTSDGETELVGYGYCSSNRRRTQFFNYCFMQLPNPKIKQTCINFKNGNLSQRFI